MEKENKSGWRCARTLIDIAYAQQPETLFMDKILNIIK